MHRISSTQLSTWLDCPRKWYYNHVMKRERIVSEAMATGTMFHAMMEHRISHGGEMPRRMDVAAQPGNYDPPSVAMREYPGAWDMAYGMARVVDLSVFHIPENENAHRIELSLDEFGLMLDGDVKASGYIDWIHFDDRMITDWKTRARFNYAPRTRMDFLGNVQLCYYAAAVARALDWPDVTVRHVNVLRSKKPRMMIAEAVLRREELDPLWEMLDTTIVPQMKADAARIEAQVRTVPDACFQYGPCPHLQVCGTYNPDGLSPITRRLRKK